MTAEQPWVGPGGIGGGDAIAVHFGAGTPPRLWLVILTSVVAVMFVFVGGLAVGPLFPGAASRKPGSSSTAVPVTEKLCAEASVHCTVHENGTAVGVDTARGVFWTVAGFALAVEQSAGRVKVAETSVDTGPVGPLLCTLTVPFTANVVGAFGLLTGEEAETEVTLMSAVTGQTPGVAPSGPTAIKMSLLPPSGA
jgi:hypothetical protein